MIQKVLRVGTSAAVTVPKKSLHEAGIKIGDRISTVIKHAPGRLAVAISRLAPAPIELSPADERVLSVSKDLIERYRQDLASLAKR